MLGGLELVDVGVWSAADVGLVVGVGEFDVVPTVGVGVLLDSMDVEGAEVV